MDPIRIEQLTKEMVAEELRIMGDPCASAALVVRKTLEGALKDPAAKADAERIIEESVKGAMTALLLADQSLARGSVLILEAVADRAMEHHLDPTDCMRAALKGLADLRRFVEPSRLDDIRLEIDAHYMGAGEVFVEYLRRVAVAP
jgi:hypothetical protein